MKTENETFYPGEMNNSTLIDQNSNLKRILLKENLLEHHDYEAVPKNVFRYLKKWYGIDIEIVRLLKIDPLENKIYLELYPGLFLNNFQFIYFVKEKKVWKKRNQGNLFTEGAIFTENPITLNTINDLPSVASRGLMITTTRKNIIKNQNNCKIF